MTSPPDMDRPATVLSASLGVVLIAISVLLFLFVGDGDKTNYVITWSEVEVEEADNTFAAQGQTQTVPLEVPSAQVSNITVSITCTEAQGTPARPATVTWTLKEGSRTWASGTTPCITDETLERVNITDQPDVGSIDAKSASAAEQKAYEAGTNQTRNFTLEFSYTRPAATVPNPLPVAQPTIAGRMGLVAEAWHAQASDPEEVTR